ncbi:MAG TPA: LssY C-terminal domain-containing protein [Lacipirellulaceae bacterium]|nr:LssY C-terminal domain-containing protein [Lacipirellulaceae bacterium]
MYEDLIADKPARQRKTRRWSYILLGIAVLYVLGAYIIAPMAWKTYAHYRPSFDDHPRITQTSDGHPGDPLNVSLIGTRAQIDAIMQAAKWYPAAALGLKNDLRIAADTILSRPDDEAPVSNLFLFGRKEDLAFEQPVGDNPRKRHHVRFWNTGKYADAAGRPIWVGSASYDKRVGLSHTTGQITHHIASDVDAERDHLFENLKATGELSEDFCVENFHKQLEGRNGGGDRWFTDGKLSVGVIAERNQ